MKKQPTTDEMNEYKQSCYWILICSAFRKHSGYYMYLLEIEFEVGITKTTLISLINNYIAKGYLHECVDHLSRSAYRPTNDGLKYFYDSAYIVAKFELTYKLGDLLSTPNKPQQPESDSLSSIAESLKSLVAIQSQTDERFIGEQSKFFHNLRDEALVHFSEQLETDTFDEDEFINFAYKDAEQRVALSTCKRWLAELVALGKVKKDKKEYRL